MQHIVSLLRRPRLPLALLICGAALLAACSAEKVDPNVVVVHVGGGTWAEANLEAYVRPFEKETGIKVITVADDMKVSQLKLMDAANHVEIDVVDLMSIEAARGARLGLFVDIDYSRFKPEELAGIPEKIRKPYGAPALYYSMVIAYDAKRFPAPPTSWADVWDVQKFPGKRTLFTGQYGDGPWEEALLADGVPPDQIYPIDVERAFRSLERIRPHVVKWWRVGSEGQQLFRDRQVEIGGAYDGRISDLKRNGIDFTYVQGKLLLDYWVILKKGPHRENAQRFVEFATRAKQQAIFAQKIAYGPTNLGAYQHIPADVASKLPSSPENIAKQLTIDPDWYVATGPDGTDNTARMINRWNQWVLE